MHIIGYHFWLLVLCVVILGIININQNTASPSIYWFVITFCFWEKTTRVQLLITWFFNIMSIMSLIF